MKSSEFNSFGYKLVDLTAIDFFLKSDKFKIQ